MFDEKITISHTQFAKLLGVSIRTITDLISRGIVNKDHNGKLNLFDNIKSYSAHIREQAAGRSGEKNSLAEERTRLAKEQADRLEMENAITRGDLIKIEDIRRENDYLSISIKNKAEAIPTKTAPLLIGIDDIQTAKEILEKAIREMLVDLSKLEYTDAV